MEEYLKESNALRVYDATLPSACKAKCRTACENAVGGRHQPWKDSAMQLPLRLKEWVAESL